jgi:genome maintenance exonuclease 1
MFTHNPHNFPKLIQENIDGTRYYVTPNGEKYPSVTTVLSEYGKEGIMEWRKKVGEEKANQISRTATTRGTAVHAAIEKYLNNEDMTGYEMMPNAKGLYVKLKPELQKLNNIHCLEERLYSHELQLAGTVDCIAEHKGILSVIDFKTSIRLKKKEHIKSYFMQGAAYSKMFFDMTGIKIDRIVILIGVDTANFCQTMIENPWDHIDDLKRCIDNYHKGKQNGT